MGQSGGSRAQDTKRAYPVAESDPWREKWMKHRYIDTTTQISQGINDGKQSFPGDLTVGIRIRSDLILCRVWCVIECL